MDRPNVLVIQRILPPYRTAFFKQLSLSEHMNVTVACGEPSSQSSLESITNLNDIRIKRVRNQYIGKNEMVIIQHGIHEIIRDGGFDVLIAEFNPRILSNLVVFLRAKRQGLPFIWWGHGIRPRKRFQRVYSLLSKRADATIFYTQPGADLLIAQGLPAEKGFVAWNSIETDEIDALAQQFVPDARDSILYIGRLIPEKKTELLLRAFIKAVKSHNLNANLIFIGEGPERNHLEQLAAEAKLQDRVKFVGSSYDQSQLAPYFNQSRFSVSPGYIGLSALHSMAYGLPVLVADNEPHSPEIVAVEAGCNGRFFPANNVDAFADALTQMYCDQEDLTAMSQAAHRTLQSRFSIHSMVSGFEQAVDYVTAQRRKTG